MAFAAVSVGVAVAQPAHEPSSVGSEAPLLRSIHAGTARRSPAPPARHAATIPGVPRWGMNGDDVLQASTDAEREALLADMKAAGAGLIRLDVTWSYIQPSRGSWNWWYYDKVMNEIEHAGLKAIMLLDYGNAAYGSTTNQAPPPNVADFASFATTAAQRYAPLGLHIFEVWNEPNIGANWDGRADPAAYTNLLKATYLAIKEVDSAAIVVSGGIAPTTTGGGNISQQAFLTGMLAAGAGRYLDAVGYHPYVGSGWDQLPAMRQIMVNYGLASKQIWATRDRLVNIRRLRPVAGGPSHEPDEPMEELLVVGTTFVVRTRGSCPGRAGQFLRPLRPRPRGRESQAELVGVPAARDRYGGAPKAVSPSSASAAAPTGMPGSCESKRPPTATRCADQPGTRPVSENVRCLPKYMS